MFPESLPKYQRVPQMSFRIYRAAHIASDLNDIKKKDHVLGGQTVMDLTLAQAEFEEGLARKDSNAHVEYAPPMVLDRISQTFVPTSIGKEVFKDMWTECKSDITNLRNAIVSLFRWL